MTGPVPEQIETPAQLGAALKELCGSRSLRDIKDAAEQLRARGERVVELPRSTVSGVFMGKSVPSEDTLTALLRVCGIDDEPTRQEWLDARDRVEHRHQRRPPGAVRVRDARARVLGVHAAIQTPITSQRGQRPAEPESELPPYVPRDLDADLRTLITVAGQRGGFVLLVGDSSVGKTRTLFASVRAVLPAWWLLHPADATSVRHYAAAPTARTVVWLDELQHYLNHPAGLPAAAIRQLISAGVVVVATLWPDEYSKRIAPPTPGQPDPYAEDRQLLGLAEVTTVPDAFSAAERRRAEELAATDSRVRIALDTPDAGFTQGMAAGPELVRWWENAPPEHCYGQAVITAALDARRIGALVPLTRDYLEAAVPGYLTSRQRADAPPHWLQDALAYATTTLHGATATLCPVDAGMGRLAGYNVADYLHQHALRVRGTTHLPDTAWHALINHHHPDDSHRLLTNAYRRGRAHEAEIIARPLADNGDKFAATAVLADLLRRQGRIDEALTWLHSRVEVGEHFVISRLADLLVTQGQIGEVLNLLRSYTGSFVADHLAEALGKHTVTGQLDREVIRSVLAFHSDEDAASTARLLAERGQIDEALNALRSHSDNGDILAATELVDLLVEQGRIVELTAEVAAGTLGALHALRAARASTTAPDGPGLSPGTGTPLMRAASRRGRWQ